MESDLSLKWVVKAGASIQRNILLLKLSLIRFYNYSNTNVDQNNATTNKCTIDYILNFEFNVIFNYELNMFLVQHFRFSPFSKSYNLILQPYKILILVFFSNFF